MTGRQVGISHRDIGAFLGLILIVVVMLLVKMLVMMVLVMPMTMIEAATVISGHSSLSFS